MADKKEYVYAESVVDGLIVNIPVREINSEVRKSRTGYSATPEDRPSIPPFSSEAVEIPLLWKELPEEEKEDEYDVEYCVRTNEDFEWILLLMYEMPMSVERLKERFSEYFVEEVEDPNRPLDKNDYAIFIEEDDMSTWIQALTELEYTKEEREEEDAYYSEHDDELEDDDEFDDHHDDLEDDDDYGIFTDDDDAEDEDDDDTK